MATFRKETGDLAEGLALSYLQDKGYECIAKNYSNKLGEIDIIAKHDGVLCFIEVRSLSSNELSHPFESVNIYKQRRITKAAYCFIQEYDMYDMPARFDVVAVSFTNSQPVIELVENAFEASI